jgi:hypothetical protein
LGNTTQVSDRLYSPGLSSKEAISFRKGNEVIVIRTIWSTTNLG